MKTKSDWLEYLGFYLEKQDDVWMVIDQIGESRTATMPERVLWDALMEALSGVQALSAAPAVPAPLSEQDERKAFEQDFMRVLPGENLKRKFGHYEDPRTRHRWDGWKARAALAAQGGE